MLKSAQQRAIIELIFAGSLWGFGFIAAKWGMGLFSALELTLIRLAVPAVLIVVLGFLVRSWQFSQTELKAGFLPALFLIGTLVPQTLGLSYTTATKSAFLTTLYVLIVPLLEAIYFKKGFSLRHGIAVILAVLGTALMLELKIDSWNLGDTLSLLCAFFAALHIISVEHIAKLSPRPLHLNLAQCFWGAIVTAGILCFYNPSPGTLEREFSLHALIGVLMLTFGSTVIAFSLQVKAQRVVSANLASVLFLLESPFSMFFAFLLLDERAGILQLLGALIILFACYVSITTKKLSNF